MMIGRFRTLHVRSLLAAFLLLASITGSALAFQSAPRANTNAEQKPSAPSPPPVSAEQALYLIRSTLMTLNDANRSGNYTVLRDLAAPDFRARNTAADLAQAFSDMRRRNVDLFAVALINPQLDSPPALDSDGRLRLSGFFPTRPLQIRFDLTFQVAGGQWRPFAISVATPEAPAQPRTP